MKNYQLIEDYFVKLHQNYGISELSYKDKRLEIDEHNIKNLFFYLRILMMSLIIY
jgi:hypothetical protein